MTLKTRLAKLEKAVKPSNMTWLDSIADDTVFIIHDGSDLDGASMTKAEYVEYSKAHPGPVITITEIDGEKVTDFHGPSGPAKRYIGFSPLDWDKAANPGRLGRTKAGN
jgi:hypothetical protein